eukprot:TRINITY_DN2650_c0_g2_i3.p1 TRINITY_DN2650_c0_g2~~TRINITY_DN2650_c0_g2_i3.p1  ORF type:complete len:471 (-),score=31.02 TRINITY_DN2650_c0_g2_i3:99-1364(-)
MEALLTLLICHVDILLATESAGFSDITEAASGDQRTFLRHILQRVSIAFDDIVVPAIVGGGPAIDFPGDGQVILSSPVPVDQQQDSGIFTKVNPLCLDSSGSLSNPLSTLYPFAVSLQAVSSIDSSYYQHFCGGAMIGERTVLTAGHCIFDLFADVDFRQTDEPEGQLNTEIWVAIEPLCRHQEGIGRFKVIKYFLPEQYNGNILQGYDIAILLLEESSEAYNSAFPDVSQSANYNGQDLTVIGWGFTNEEEATTSDAFKTTVEVLQQANLQYEGKDREACGDNLPYDQFCANFISITDDGLMADSCGGDSGSPILIQNDNADAQRTIVGVVSWGAARRCTGTDGLPGVYTEVSLHLDWIEQVLQSIQNQLQGVISPSPSPSPLSSPSPITCTLAITFTFTLTISTTPTTAAFSFNQQSNG